MIFTVVASQTESQQSIFSTVQQEMAQRRKQKTSVTAVKNGNSNGLGNIAPVVVPPFISRQDSR